MEGIEMLTVTQYAKLRGITRNAVIKRLAPIAKPLPGVLFFKLFGGVYMLKVDIVVAKKAKKTKVGRKKGAKKKFLQR